MHKYLTIKLDGFTGTALTLYPLFVSLNITYFIRGSIFCSSSISTKCCCHGTNDSRSMISPLLSTYGIENSCKLFLIRQ